MTEIADPRKDHFMCIVYSKDLADLLMQILDIVAVPLLSETAEIIEILSDLGSGDFHNAAEILGRDPFRSIR